MNEPGTKRPMDTMAPLDAAIRWRLQLDAHGDDTQTLRAFTAWLEARPENQRAFALGETVLQSVEAALTTSRRGARDMTES